MTERTYYKREIIQICEDRGFTQLQVMRFLNLYNNMEKGYTKQMVDQFEFAVNGPVMLRNHPDMHEQL